MTVRSVAATGRSPIGSAAALLDRAAVRATLAHALGPHGLEVTATRVDYLRGKLHTSALLGLTVEWRAGSEAGHLQASMYVADPARVAEAHAKACALHLERPVIGPAIACAPWRDGAGVETDARVLLVAFPNDRAVRGLSAVAVPRRLKNRIQAGVTLGLGEGARVRERRSRVELIRWKPARRAVLLATLGWRDDGTGARGEHRAYLRAYPAVGFRTTLARWQRAAGFDLSVPSVEGVDAERHWFATRALPGTPLAQRLECDAIPSPAKLERHPLLDESAGLALAPLYQSEPLVRADSAASDRHDLRAAVKALEALAAWWPERVELVRDLSASLMRFAGELRPIAVHPRHGDLTADQILMHAEGYSLLDWDELGDGDPHADIANLAVDVALRTGRALELDSAERIARAAIGACYDAGRLEFHLALAYGRRVLRGLQVGDPEWREGAGACLAGLGARLAANPAVVTRAGSSRAPVASPLSRSLEILIDSRRRSELLGHRARDRRLAAVWPHRDGAIARFEPVAESGRIAFWLKLDPHASVIPAGIDLELPSFTSRLAESGSRVLSHRLGRRATLAFEERPDRVLALRPTARIESLTERLSNTHDLLLTAGFQVPRVFEREGPDGLWLERIEGKSPTVRAPAELWHALGEALAGIHACAPLGLPARGPAEAMLAAERQIRLAALADPELGAALWRGLDSARQQLSELEDSAAPRASSVSLIHGDLHLGQIVTAGGRPYVLDWEQAHRGEPAEDLGNFAAELEWWLPGEAHALLTVVVEAYRAAGGHAAPSRTLWWQRLSRLRLLALHSWRDGERERARRHILKLAQPHGEIL
ncbi:MAG: phosphotransferase [Candidatus Eisenbacteria bacterium]|uniref:Phosphotransferase n=1 Tax=Eiseniibacteriota bacterium TaxID=2212470 RepID=A0A849SM38_UNCEI|nr:phosphotransferase [Candidatus Eisenbacteria bacterium]